MFWKYNLITVSQIETLLDKGNVTLRELMDEDDVLQECKAQTPKLIDFLIRPEVMDEMVTLITQEPDEQMDEKVRYKYSNIACELLTFDITAINDALAGNESLLNKLYSFLDKEKPLNPLLASFYSKTMTLLALRKTDVVLPFIMSKGNFIDLLLNHIETSAIMDLMKSILCYSDNIEMREKIMKWLGDQNVVKRLIALIDPAYSEDCNCNVAHSLCDMIKSCRDHMSLLQEKAESEPLLETVESTEVVSDLLNHMFNGEKKESVIVNGVTVLMTLLEFKKHGPASSQQVLSTQSQSCFQAGAETAPQVFTSFFFRNDGPEQITALDAERLLNGVNNVLAAINPQLVHFHKLLLEPPPKPAITLTTGRLDPPLGSSRLEVAHLIMALIATNTHSVNVELCKLGTIPVLLDLFFQYKWNNFLHTQVEHSIGRVIANAPTTDEEGNKVHPLLDQLLTQYKLTQRILQCFEEAEEEQNGPSQQRKGYMGHLTKIANHIAQCADNGVNDSLIQEKIKQISDEHHKKWESFTSGTLAEINKYNVTPLVGGMPIPSNTEDDEAVDFGDMPFLRDSSTSQDGSIRGLRAAFPKMARSGGVSEPLMQQMASNFVDQFAFNDDFNEADENLSGQINRLAHVHFHLTEDNLLQRNVELFEQVCREKQDHQIQGDDVDSDEDVWEDEDKKNHSLDSKRKQLKLFGDYNSSDSDDDTRVSGTSNALDTTVSGNNEDMKMDIDNQDGWTANFDSVPMEVAPASIQNPWEAVEQPSSTSGEQENWADFSNFSSVGSSKVECSDEISSTTAIAMETTESTPISVKFDSNSEVSSTSDIPSVGVPHVPVTSSASLELVTSDDRPACDRIPPIPGDSTSSKDLESEAKPLTVNDSDRLEINKQKDMSALFENEPFAASSTVQNGPV